MTFVLIALAAFVAMEPITAATHRWVMHGVGWVLHRSHHQARATRFEANDAFPVAFASVVCLTMVVGFNVDGWSALVPAAAGVTLYGAAYALVHDVYVHGRVPWLRTPTTPTLDRLAAAHRLHHRFNGAPYGMLMPVVPARIRQRAASTTAAVET